MGNLYWHTWTLFKQWNKLRWSYKYDFCQICYTCNSKHKGNWFCTKCYDRLRNKKKSRKEQQKKSSNKYHIKNYKHTFNIKWYKGKIKRILEEDKYKEMRKKAYNKWYDKEKYIKNILKEWSIKRTTIFNIWNKNIYLPFEIVDKKWRWINVEKFNLIKQYYDKKR